MEFINQWWWSLPHKQIEGSLSTFMLVLSLVYIVYAFTGLHYKSTRRPNGSLDNSGFYKRNKIMMMFCIALATTNLLRVPFSVSASENIWIGLLPLLLAFVWSVACFSLYVSRKSMRRLDASLEESLAALNRIENRTYTAKISRDVWPPDPT